MQNPFKKSELFVGGGQGLKTSDKGAVLVGRHRTQSGQGHIHQRKPGVRIKRVDGPNELVCQLDDVGACLLVESLLLAGPYFGILVQEQTIDNGPCSISFMCGGGKLIR